jgi:hypothetical protein
LLRSGLIWERFMPKIQGLGGSDAELWLVSQSCSHQKLGSRRALNLLATSQKMTKQGRHLLCSQGLNSW